MSNITYSYECTKCQWKGTYGHDEWTLHQMECPACGEVAMLDRIVEGSDSDGAGKETAMQARVTRVTIAPKGETVDSSEATHVAIADEGGGEFVAISQPFSGHGIRINIGEWERIRVAVDDAIARCRTSEENRDA